MSGTSMIFDHIECPGCKKDLGIGLFDLFFIVSWACPHCGNIVKLTLEDPEQEVLS